MTHYYFSSISCVILTSKDISQEEIDRLNGIENLSISQKTPIRVLHRRSLAIRAKTIHSIKAKKLTPYALLIQIETQAGT
jgi:tRNA pseudouridine synthase 10